LDESLVPVLLPALEAVARTRPENPVEYLAYYLLKNNPNGFAPAEEATPDEEEGQYDMEP